MAYGVRVCGQTDSIKIGPPPFRITWVASCSFFWLVIKSVITHAEYNEAAAAGVVVAAAVDDVEGDV